MPRAAIYARVSTQEQTVEPQLIQLRAAAESRKAHIVAEYIDIASGRKDKRPSLMELMAAAKRGEFDMVLVVKLDRIARSTAHFMRIVDELTKSGVGIVAVTQGIDTTDASPTAKLLRNIFAIIAELEADLIGERTKAGIAAARRNHSGKWGAALWKNPPQAPAHWRATVDSWIAVRGSVSTLAASLGCSRSKAWRLSQQRIAERNSAVA